MNVSSVYLVDLTRLASFFGFLIVSSPPIFIFNQSLIEFASVADAWNGREVSISSRFMRLRASYHLRALYWSSSDLRLTTL